jgi:hypothetical protein
VITLCREQGFSSRLATGTFCRGQALAAQGEEEKGIAQMLEGSAGYRTVGAPSYRTGFLAALAEAHLKRGRPDEAMGPLTEALAIAESTGERYQEARLRPASTDVLVVPGASPIPVANNFLPNSAA